MAHTDRPVGYFQNSSKNITVVREISIIKFLNGFIIYKEELWKNGDILNLSFPNDI